MPMCFDLFLSTPSARRATSCISHTVWCIAISIHALREEGDVYRQDRGYRRSGISIHALREEGDLHRRKHITIHQISIHALREEGDIQNAWNVICEFISIHALREEGDPGLPKNQPIPLSFLSTPSARRATRHPQAQV